MVDIKFEKVKETHGHLNVRKGKVRHGHLKVRTDQAMHCHLNHRTPSLFPSPQTCVGLKERPCHFYIIHHR